MDALGTNALLYTIHAGQIPVDGGSRWFETYLMALTVKTDDELLGRWVRVVSNIDVPPESPERAFTVDGEVLLKRVNPTNGG